MKIENLRSEKKGKRARVAATVTWENCDRPTQEVYIEVDERFAHDLSSNPHTFLLACAIPAMHHGEERVFMDGKICPEFRDGLIVAISWLRQWFEPSQKLVQIEAKTLGSSPTPRTPERAGFFFSGGIDSLATLRANRLNFPLEHPGSFKDGLLIYGLNVESDNRIETFDQAVTALSEVASDASIMLIPVYTNIRYLDDDHDFFLNQFHGAILAAVAHAFAKRLTVVSISASQSIPTTLPMLNRQHFQPSGSDPLTDPNYSSNDLRIRHVGLELSRLDKTRLVADWDAGLQNIKVCQPNWPGDNCGRCEKCVRTMLGLLSLRVLDKTRAFPEDDISHELVTNLRFKKQTHKDDYSIEYDYMELIAPLAEIGRYDLVQGIEHLIARSRYREPGLKEKLKAFDQRYFKGSLSRLKRLFYS